MSTAPVTQKKFPNRNKRPIFNSTASQSIPPPRPEVEVTLSDDEDGPTRKRSKTTTDLLDEFVETHPMPMRIHSHTVNPAVHGDRRESIKDPEYEPEIGEDHPLRNGLGKKSETTKRHTFDRSRVETHNLKDRGTENFRDTREQLDENEIQRAKEYNDTLIEKMKTDELLRLIYGDRESRRNMVIKIVTYIYKRYGKDSFSRQVQDTITRVIDDPDPIPSLAIIFYAIVREDEIRKYFYPTMHIPDKPVKVRVDPKKFARAFNTDLPRNFISCVQYFLRRSNNIDNLATFVVAMCSTYR